VTLRYCAAALNQTSPTWAKRCNKIATNTRWYLYDDFGRKDRGLAYRGALARRVRLTESESRDTRWLSSLGANGMPRTLSSHPNLFDPNRSCPRLGDSRPSYISGSCRSFFFSRTILTLSTDSREFSWWSRESSTREHVFHVSSFRAWARKFFIRSSRWKKFQIGVNVERQYSFRVNIKLLFEFEELSKRRISKTYSKTLMFFYGRKIYC